MMKNIHPNLLAIFILSLDLISCKENNPVPKPPSYLNINFPEHNYTNVKGACPYELKLASIYNFKIIDNLKSNYCVQEIDLGPLNGSLLLYYISLHSKDSLANIINFSNDRVDEHKIKADKIDFEQIVDKKNKVFGTFFELRGNVATNFQFYLTDSTKNFIRGEVLLNCRPNYDSLRSSLQYLKVDLLELVRNFKWKKD